MKVNVEACKMLPTVSFQSTREHDAYSGLYDAMALVGAVSSEAGWWSTPRENGTLLMLMVSEIAEAMEGDRKGLRDDKLRHRSMLEVELADAVIRILDFAAHNGLDLPGAIIEKSRFNATRPDHRPENRAAEGGKRY